PIASRTEVVVRCRVKLLKDKRNEHTEHRVCVFVASRRRHTRFSRDWSSDVCSSDLAGDVGIGGDDGRHLLALVSDLVRGEHRLRSEERRVGKSVVLCGRRMMIEKYDIG